MSTETINTSLWKGVCNGERKALELLYSNLYIDLYNYGIHVSSDKDQVKDAINDMFLELWGNRMKLPVVTSVKSYLFTYLRRKLYAFTKQTKKSNFIIQTLTNHTNQTELSREEVISEQEAEHELQKRMLLVINKLTNRQKQLVELRYFGNLSVEEIAEQTNISVKTVYNTICTALQLMEKRLLMSLFALFVLSF